MDKIIAIALALSILALWNTILTLWLMKIKLQIK